MKPKPASMQDIIDQVNVEKNPTLHVPSPESAEDAKIAADTRQAGQVTDIPPIGSKTIDTLIGKSEQLKAQLIGLDPMKSYFDVKDIQVSENNIIPTSLSSTSAKFIDNVSLKKKQKNYKGQREEKAIPYLPIDNVYLLLDYFFPGWNSITGDLVVTDEKYSSTYDGNTTESVVCKKEITLQLPGKMPMSMVATGVASYNVLKSDDARYGFEGKLTARGIKTLCKPLGRVFRMSDPTEDDVPFIPTEKEEAVVPAKKENKVNVMDAIASKAKTPAPSVAPAEAPSTLTYAASPASTPVVGVIPETLEQSAPVVEAEVLSTDAIANEYSKYLNDEFEKLASEPTKQNLLELTTKYVGLKGYKQKTPEHSAVLAYYKEVEAMLAL